MAWQVSKRVWEHIKTDTDKKINQGERLILLALADIANEHGICLPKYDTSYQTLGEMAGVNRRSAIRLIESLCKKGLLIKSENVGRGNSNLFLVTIGLCQEEIEAFKSINGVTSNTIYNEESKGEQKEKVLPVTPGGVTSDTIYAVNGVASNTHPIIENPSIPSLSSKDDSGKPQEDDSKKWNKANKNIMWDKFIELTHLPPPNQKNKGAWYGWLYEIFEMSNKDPTEACRVMAIVIDDMLKKHLTISSPKSLHWGIRALVSGQELNGGTNGQNKQQHSSPDDRPEPARGTGKVFTGLSAAFKAGSRGSGGSP